MSDILPHSTLTQLLLQISETKIKDLPATIDSLISVTRHGVAPEGGQIGDSVSVVSPVASVKGPAPRDMIRFIPWGATVSKDFLEGVLWIEGQIGLAAENLMPCMKFESNFNPQARNPKSSATGLIQFMDATAKRLGTTTAALYNMDAVTQLSYVYKYFLDYHKRGFKLDEWDIMDTYMAILWPAGIGKPLSHRVFVNDPARSNDAYDVNRGLDVDKDGFVTKLEACDKVLKLAQQGLGSNAAKIPTVLA